MTISLGGITLNPDMVWREQFTSQTVAQSVRRTLGGVPVIFSGNLQKGAPITLSATEVNGGPVAGLLKKSVVDSIMALAEVAGATYTLTYNGTSYTVMFRHDDPPAVDMEPMKKKQSYVDDDFFRGDIKLLTV